MQRRIGYFIAWAVVTGVSVLIATQAVGTVRDQVTDTPATLATVAADLVVTTTTVPPVDSTLPDVTVTTVDAGSTSTTSQVPDEPSTTVATTSPPPTSTTTTRPPATTTTTTTTTQAPAQMETATYQMTGGWVRIRYGGGEVYLVDYAPASGYSVEVKRDGPLKVELEFEGKDYEGKFKADMEDGPLDVDIQESDDD